PEAFPPLGTGAGADNSRWPVINGSIQSIIRLRMAAAWTRQDALRFTPLILYRISFDSLRSAMMRFTIELPEALFAAVRKKALARKTTPEKLIVAWLSEWLEDDEAADMAWFTAVKAEAEA